MSVWLLGGCTPSQILLQVVAKPQKEGSSEWEDPSELPSDGESLNTGGSNLFVRGAGFKVGGTPLHRIPPLKSFGLTCKDAVNVSTFSMGFTLRRLFCMGKIFKRACVSFCNYAAASEHFYIYIRPLIAPFCWPDTGCLCPL